MMVNGFVSMNEYNMLMKKNSSLQGRLVKMEMNVASVAKKGQSARCKKGWTPVEYTNDHLIRKYCREKIWPYYCRLGEGWSNYSENPRSLCARIMEQVEMEEGSTKRGTWNIKSAPSVNNIFIDLMSKDSSVGKKQFKRE